MNPFSWTLGLIIVKAEAGNWYYVSRWKPTVYLDVFENYDVHLIIPQNNESGEPDLNKIRWKCQNKNEFILHNDLRDTRCKYITYMSKEPYPPIMGQLDNFPWIHYSPLSFLEDNNSTSPLQKGGIVSGWFTSEEKSCTNSSVNFLNIDELFQPQMGQFT